MTKRKKKRLKTLIISTIILMLSIIGTIISLTKVIYYENLSTTEKNYENLSTLVFFIFVIFSAISIYLLYMMIRYKEMTYDKWFCAYKVYGIIDPNPDSQEGFIHVIFKRKSNYYIQDECYETDTIKRFIPLLPEETENIKELSLFYSDSPYSCIIGGKPLIGFRYNFDQLVIYTEKEIEKFLANQKFSYDLDFDYLDK